MMASLSHVGEINNETGGGLLLRKLLGGWWDRLVNSDSRTS